MIVESNSMQELPLAMPDSAWISMRQQKIDKKHVVNIGPHLELALMQAFELVLCISWDIGILNNYDMILLIVLCLIIIRLADCVEEKAGDHRLRPANFPSGMCRCIQPSSSRSAEPHFQDP
jgi:hypothetical protein